MRSSPFLLAKQLESDVTRLLSYVDLTLLDLREQQQIRDLKHSFVDVRLDIQDYELAETREHQLRNAKDARKRLDHIQALIVANPANTFGAVDVAHITAYIGQIADNLR